MGWKNRPGNDEDWALPELDGWKHVRKKKTKERGPKLEDYLGPAVPDALNGMITGTRDEVQAATVVQPEPEPRYVAMQEDPNHPLPPLPQPSRRFAIEQLEPRS